MKKGSGPFFQKWCQGLLPLFLFAAASAHAQNCPTIDRDKQNAEERACKAAGGAWARHGVRDHLCATESAPRIGAEAEGRCTAVKTSFGCVE